MVTGECGGWAGREQQDERRSASCVLLPPPIQHKLELPQRCHAGRIAAAAAAVCCGQIWQHSVTLPPEAAALDHPHVSLAPNLLGGKEGQVLEGV